MIKRPKQEIWVFLFLISVRVVIALKVPYNQKSFLYLISVSLVIGLLTFWEIFGKFLEIYGSYLKSEWVATFLVFFPEISKKVCE